MNKTQKIILFLWFYLGWFGCVFFAKWNIEIYSLVFPLIPFIFFLKFKWYDYKRLVLMLVSSIFGMLFDWGMYFFGFIKFSDQNPIFIPTWLVSMWFLFALILPLSHEVFKNRLVLAALLGAIFGPLSYYSGEAFQVLFVSGSIGFLIYTIFWGIYFPLIHHIYRKL